MRGSLRRLGVERLDLYQFHWPDDTGTAIEDSWAEMARLVAEGKVRAAGVCNFDLGLLGRCEALRHVDSLQPGFSMIRRGVAAQELPWCARARDGRDLLQPDAVRAADGRLRRGARAAWRRDDWRAAPGFQSPRWSATSPCATPCGPSPLRHETTVAAVAVAWTLAWPGVSGAIVGARAPGRSTAGSARPELG